MPPKEDPAEAIAAAQRVQTSLQKMIDAAEKEEQNDKELTDTQVALRRHGLNRALPLRSTSRPALPAG